MIIFAPPPVTKGWGERVLIRLLRRWAACRELHRPALTPLVQLADDLGASPHAGVALASLFQLAEGLLGSAAGRRVLLRPEPSRDERAVLLMLRTPATPVRSIRRRRHHD